MTARGQTGAWRSLSSLRETTALSRSETHVWVGTTGGVYSHAVSGGEMTRYTVSEGLHGLRVTALLYDAECGSSGCVWIGYESGVLDRLNVATGEVTGYRDIERATRYAARRIKRLILAGDRLLIATDFGLVAFEKAAGEVAETYDQFGPLDMATPVYDAVTAPGSGSSMALWVATARGVAIGQVDGSNLQDPSAWAVETAGLPSTEVLSLAYFDGSLFAGTTKGLALRDAAGAYVMLGVTDAAVTQLIPTPAALLGIDAYDFITVTPGGAFSRLVISEYDQPVAFAAGADGAAWFGHRLAGLVPARLRPEEFQAEVLRDCLSATAACYPGGPYHSQFPRLEVDNAGRLWAAGVLGSDTGLYRLDAEGAWTDFINRRRPELGVANSFSRIHPATDGSTWGGSDGAGALRISAGDEIELFGRMNSTLGAVEGVPSLDFIIVGGIGSDAAETVWVTNVGAPQPLHIRHPSGTWTGLDFPEGCGGFSGFGSTFREIYVDRYGQKWINVIQKANFARKQGVLVLDTKNTPTDPGDDECRTFRNEPGRGESLPSDSVNAVVEDRDGFIWVATDQGIAYTYNTGVVAADASAVFTWPLLADRSTALYILQGVKVNDLAVDPANRIWAATNTGLYLIEKAEEGYREVAHFTTDNSPLLTNDVRAVRVNPLTGEVFAATTEGLMAYGGDAVQAAAESTELFVYPNPAVMGAGADALIRIRNLVEATEVMILTADGTLVNRFEARGGQASWDGRDAAGQLVPSGVYLVVAVGKDGEGAAYGKVAVIR